MGGAGVQQSVVLADSSSGASSADIAAAFQAGAGRTKLAIQSSGGDMRLSGPSNKRKHVEDEEDDDALLDQLWGKNIVKASGGDKPSTPKAKGVPEATDAEAESEAPAEPDGAAPSAPTPKRRRTSLPGAGAPPNPPVPSPGPRAAARGRDFDNAESVLLKCDQMLQALNSERFASLAPGQVQVLIDKVNGRLTGELVAAYSAAGVEDGRGMRILEQLRFHQTRLPAVKTFVASVKATTGPEATAASITAQATKLRELQVGFHSQVTELLIHRLAAESMASKDWPGVFRPLKWTATPAEQADPLTIASLSEDSARDLQSKLLTKLIYNLCRVEDPKGSNSTAQRDEAAESLCHLLSEASRSELLDQNLKKEASHLHKLSFAAVSASPTDKQAAVAAAAQTELLSNKHGFFYRALTLFSTGMWLVSRVAERAAEAEKDKAHTQELASLFRIAGTIQPPTAAGCLQNGRVLLPHAEAWADIHKGYHNILANSTSGFKTAEKVPLAELEMKLQSVAVVLEQAAKERFQELLSITAQETEPFLAPEKPQAEESVADLWAALAKGIVDTADMQGYEGVAGTLRAQGFQAMQAQCRKWVLQVASGAAWMVAVADGRDLGMEVLLTGAPGVFVGIDQCLKAVTACSPLVSVKDLLAHKVRDRVEQLLYEGLSSCSAFVHTFYSQSAGKAFDAKLTGKQGGEYLQQLIDAADKAHEALSPRIADLHTTKVTLAGGHQVEWPFVIIAPRLLAVGQALARASEDKLALPTDAHDKAMKGAAALVNDHLAPLLKDIKGVDLWPVPDAAEALKTKLKAAGAYFRERTAQLVEAATGHLPGVGKRLHASLLEAVATEEVKKLQKLIVPEFDVADFNSDKKEEVLKLFDAEPVAALYDGVKVAAELEQTCKAMAENIQDLRAQHPWAEDILTAGSALASQFQVFNKDFETWGQAVGTWTCVQALFRPLSPGENRKALAARVARGVPKRRFQKPMEKVLKHLADVGGIALPGDKAPSGTSE